MFPSPPGIVLVKFLQRQFIFIKGSDLFGRQDLCIDERSFIRFEYKRITGLNAHRLFKIIQCYNTESFLPVFIRDQQKIVCFMGRRQKEQSVYRIDECQWSIGLRYSFFRFDRPTSPLAKTATRISSLSSGLYENRTFPSPPQTPILGLGELAIFPLANKETNKCPGVYPWSGFFIRGFVRKPDVLHAYALFLAFPFSLSFLSRALAEERSPLLLLLPAGEKSPVAHYCLVVP